MKGFSLLEIIISLVIMAILATISFIFINPAEILKAQRDGQRLADLSVLNLAIASWLHDQNSPDMDGPNLSNFCSDQFSPKIFVSISNNASTSTAPGLPPGWSYQRTAETILRAINGTGWIPINFSSTTGGAAISGLPVDPKNTFTDNLFYSYTCKSSGKFELDARFESKKYSAGGDYAKTSTDGGDDLYIYEVGNDLNLDPLAPVGYWSLDEGTGTTTYDNSGNGNSGSIINMAIPPTITSGWQTTGCKKGNCLAFDAINDYVNIPLATSIKPSPLISVLAWGNTASSSGLQSLISTDYPNGEYQIFAPQATNSFFVQVNETLGGGGTRLDANTTINTGVWYLFGLTYDGSVLRAWKDGSQINSLNYTTTSIPYVSSYLRLGSRSGSYLFQGLIDEALVYNRALSAKEMEQIYNALK